MTPDDSVTDWLRGLEGGDPAAAQPLWERYWDRLVRLAARQLPGVPRRAADEEDVAASAFESFFRGLACGRFPQLHDRNNLWALLVRITDRKACNLAAHERRAKRDAGRVVDEAALAENSGPGLDRFAGREPTPEFAAAAAETFDRLLECLGEPELRQVAVWAMEGWTNAEIATKSGRSLPTVERRLRLIRKIWEGTDKTHP